MKTNFNIGDKVIVLDWPNEVWRIEPGIIEEFHLRDGMEAALISWDFPDGNVKEIHLLEDCISANRHQCNLCGYFCDNLHAKQFSFADMKMGLIDAEVLGGYNSTPGNGDGALDDMTKYKFSLCEFCLDWLFSVFTISPMVLEDGNVLPFVPAAKRVASDEWRKENKEFAEEANRRHASRMKNLGNRILIPSGW